MADKKISALTGATTPLAGTEVLPIVQSGSTVKVSVNNLTTGKALSANSLAVTGSTSPASGVFLPAATTLGFAANSAEGMRLTSANRLLINTTTNNDGTASQVSVYFTSGFGFTTKSNADNQYHFVFDNAAGAAVGSIFCSSTNTSYNTNSDARLKYDIKDAADAGAIIDSVQIRTFKWKATGETQTYGVIAQELCEIAPFAVNGSPDDEHISMSVDYSKLVPLLVKEVQSLRARINTLEA